LQNTTASRRSVDCLLNSWLLDLRPGAPNSGVAPLFFRDFECGLPPQMRQGHSNVVAIYPPGPNWNFINANKLPVAHIHPGHAEIIPNCRTDIDPGILITVWTRALVSKDINGSPSSGPTHSPYLAQDCLPQLVRLPKKQWRRCCTSR
jgi:hypothetical protein